MQADRPDEIDRIIRRVICRVVRADFTEDEMAQTLATIRAALAHAGYAIQLDEAQLLEKGEKLFKPVRSA